MAVVDAPRDAASSDSCAAFSSLSEEIIASSFSTRSTITPIVSELDALMLLVAVGPSTPTLVRIILLCSDKSPIPASAIIAISSVLVEDLHIVGIVHGTAARCVNWCGPRQRCIPSS